MILSKDLVSVCVPTYNGEKYLQEALDSIKAQTYQNIEVIISDDSSTDNTLQIAENFKSQSNFPVYIYHNEPKGIGANWNNSIEKSNSQYIKFLFQDDILEPYCIEDMLNTLKVRRLGVVVCKRIIIDSKSQPVNDGPWFEKYSDLQSSAGLIEKPFFVISRKNLGRLNAHRYLEENFIGEPSTSLFCKNLYYEIGPFHENLKQILDYEFWLRTLAKYDIGIISKKLVKFRIHPSQTSRINSNKGVSENTIILNTFFNNLIFHIGWKHIFILIKKKFPILQKVYNIRYRF